LTFLRKLENLKTSADLWLIPDITSVPPSVLLYEVEKYFVLSQAVGCKRLRTYIYFGSIVRYNIIV
jgi:hypothetical protein